MRRYLTLLLSLFAFITLHGQQTGSFQETITFNESDYNATRTLYYFVPEDYDANQAYKLVVGWRGGPHSNAGEFRDQLSFLADSIGAIILCPENIDHFWNEEGKTKQLFQYSVEETMSNYNIDEDFIYLTGLSFGGRHAVIVSMDTDDGPIPNLRGVIPFAAGLESELAPDYENIDQFPPACICIGTSDSQNFISVSNTLHNDISSNGGVSFLNQITGVGHTVDFSTYPEEMMECIQFIEAQYDPISSTLANNLLQLEVTASPNPNKGSFNISISNPLNYKLELLLVNKAGIVMKKEFVDTAISTELSWSIENPATGIYFLNARVYKKGGAESIRSTPIYIND